MIDTEIFEENDDVIFPFTMTERGGEYTFRSFDFLKEKIRPIIEKYDDPFCAECREEIDKAIFPDIDALGYEKQDVCDEWYYIYGSDHSVKASEIEIEMLTSESKIGDIEFEETDLAEALEYSQLCTAVRKDEKIVSVCVENFLDNEREVEVSVETLPEYRGKGYASACLAYMTNLLVEDAREVLYMCSCNNKASIRTAERAGLDILGKNYYYVCQKKDY